eukprot:553562-Pyramimonas_sp.AAC.1
MALCDLDPRTLQPGGRLDDVGVQGFRGALFYRPEQVRIGPQVPSQFFAVSRQAPAARVKVEELGCHLIEEVEILGHEVLPNELL